MTSTDILLCAMPLLVVDRAPGAPAILKSAVIDAGYTAKALDFSINFYHNQCDRDISLYESLGSVFRPNEPITASSHTAGNAWIADSIEEIRKHNPKLVGLSVFTNHQHRSTLMLAKAVKDNLPEVKIIVGGLGLDQPINTSLNNVIEIEKAKSSTVFADYISDIVDFTVRGSSGLDQMLMILKMELGQVKPNVQYFPEDDLIFKTPIPDWDDYDFDDYDWDHQVSLQVTGSRGCVRNCTFCDIGGQYGKFSYRTGEDIANEIIASHKKYGIRTFEFTDSLVNGGLKVFKEWLVKLADYNSTLDPEKRIQWFGQYICRPQSQTPNEFYPLMKKSGVINLIIGMESGSNEVLKAMDKKMTVQDAYDELEQFSKHRISTSLLLFGSFINETWPRFLETLDFIANCQSYVADGTITRFNPGIPLYITKKMPLGANADELGLVLDESNYYNWVDKNNPELDYVERCRRKMIMQELFDLLNIPANSVGFLHLKQIDKQLREMTAEYET